MLVDPGMSSVSSQRMSKSFSENSDKQFQEVFLSSILVSIFFSFCILSIGFVASSYAIDLLNYEEKERIEELNFAINIYIFAIGLAPIYSILSSFLQSLLRTFIDNSVNLI